jgi:hypothetical protein
MPVYCPTCQIDFVKSANAGVPQHSLRPGDCAWGCFQDFRAGGIGGELPSPAANAGIHCIP